MLQTHFLAKSLCVGRCTTRNKLNKGVTWSISLNLWSICIYASKTKSICEPFFDWFKITDFFIAKLIIFWEWKMTPKNSQFCYKKSVILIQSKKGCLNDLVFNILTSQNMSEHGLKSILPGSSCRHQCLLGPSVGSI